ncbi:hypothetical protein PENTCL1PPCAC_2157, partial [Pristionchus entomophagus]
IFQLSFYIPSIFRMNSFISATLGLSLIYLINCQCTGNDDPRCTGWVGNSFCTNAGYSMDMRKKYCGVACGFCNLDGTQTAAGGGNSYISCTDLNANCASMAASGFCTSGTYSNAIKLLYCCNTCRPSVLSSSTTTSGSTVTGSTTTTTTTTTTVAPGK